MDGKPSFEERFTRRADALIAWLEKDRLPIHAIFVYVVLVALARDLSEYFLLDNDFVTTPHPWIYSIAHHVGFYVVVFLGLVLLNAAFSGRGVRRSVNFVAIGWWIIILPPWIDHFIGGLNRNYAYFSPTDFLDALIHFSGTAFHIGQAVEVLIILFALFAYAIWTQRAQLIDIRDRTVTLVRIGLLVFFTFLSMFIMATPALFLPVGSSGGAPVFPSFPLTRYYQFHLFLVAYYLLAGVLLVGVISYMAHRGHFHKVLGSMRPEKTLLFAAIVMGGVVAGWRYSTGDLTVATSILGTPYWVNLGFVGVSVVAAVLSWQVTTMWNDLSDRGSDEPTRSDRALAAGVVKDAFYWQMSAVLIAVSLSMALLLSLQQALVLVAIYVLGYIYSFKPLRFKAHALSPLLIGLGTFLAFIYGAMTPYSAVATMTGPGETVTYLTGSVVTPLPTAEVLLIGLYAFLGLVIGSMVTDIDGYQEDLKAGVRTIYTGLGIRRGLYAVAGLVFFGSLTTLLLLHRPVDLLVLPALGTMAAIALLRFKRSRPVMLLAAMGLVYAAASYLGWF